MARIAAGRVLGGVLLKLTQEAVDLLIGHKHGCELNDVIFYGDAPYRPKLRVDLGIARFERLKRELIAGE